MAAPAGLFPVEYLCGTLPPEKGRLSYFSGRASLRIARSGAFFSLHSLRQHFPMTIAPGCAFLRRSAALKGLGMRCLCKSLPVGIAAPNKPQANGSGRVDENFYDTSSGAIWHMEFLVLIHIILIVFYFIFYKQKKNLVLQRSLLIRILAILLYRVVYRQTITI